MQTQPLWREEKKWKWKKKNRERNAPQLGKFRERHTWLSRILVCSRFCFFPPPLFFPQALLCRPAFPVAHDFKNKEVFDEVNQAYALSSLHRRIPCARVEKHKKKPIKTRKISFFFKKQWKAQFAHWISLHSFHYKYCSLEEDKKKRRDLSGIMFYITINRCIITIRINTALIDYLANIGIVLG